jgi:1-acyl-sn-glycerol-3-phosphate acyltransferase
MHAVLALPRAILNSFFLASWTAVSVSWGALATFVTRDSELFYRWQRPWARGLFRLCGVRVSVTGTQYMDTARGYVVVANHQSHLDIPALFATLPTIPRFLAKRELWKVPFLGAALRLGRHIPVDRSSGKSARGSIDIAAQRVEQGATVLFFPEGTRGDGEQLGKFKSGAIHVAKAARAAILPVGVVGSRSVLPKHGRFLRPGLIRVNIGRPIEAREVEGTDVKPLTDRLESLVRELAELPELSEA